MKIDLRHIRYFLVLADDLNFHRASEHLHISQPALTRTIQHLEAELGVLLFERSQNFVRLTDAGRAFREGGRRVLNGMDATIDLTRRVGIGEAGALRVGYTDFAIVGALPELLEYSTALGHLFHEHVASHSMTCGHPREVICEAVYS